MEFLPNLYRISLIAYGVRLQLQTLSFTLLRIIILQITHDITMYDAEVEKGFTG